MECNSVLGIIEGIVVVIIGSGLWVFWVRIVGAVVGEGGVGIVMVVGGIRVVGILEGLWMVGIVEGVRIVEVILIVFDIGIIILLFLISEEAGMVISGIWFIVILGIFFVVGIVVRGIIFWEFEK